MAYQIDFTASNYALRFRRKVVLRLLLLAVLAALAWGVHEFWEAYNQDTLNMRLAKYELAARPIEEMSTKWDEVAKEYNAMAHYYRLLGDQSTSPTNFLIPMASASAPQLGQGFRPVGWTLTTGGDCVLKYRYTFGAGDKAVQAKGLTNRVANLVTSVVEVMNGRVDVTGVLYENLLKVDGLDIEAHFALPNARSFPAKEVTLAACVTEIKAMREKVQKAKLQDGGSRQSAPSTAQAIMLKYLPKNFDKGTNDFPRMERVIDVGGWFKEADKFIMRNRIPGDEKERRELKEVWNRIGDARFPWGPYRPRYRALDNEMLVYRTDALGLVADGVRRFKGFLAVREVDNKKKLEPFVNAYPHDDVFNNPIIETDLKDRVAKSVGISQAAVSFVDEPKAEPAILAKKDEKFTFTWVRWTLSLGEVNKRDGQDHQGGTNGEPITLGKVSDCARRILSLGPGYALDKVRVDFDDGGCVSGAILEGLLPVKKSERIDREAK